MKRDPSLNINKLNAIRSFVRCDLSIEELQSKLGEDISLQTTSSEFRIGLDSKADVAIEFYPEDLKYVLGKFIRGEVEQNRLVFWAKTLRVWPTLLMEEKHKDVLREIIYLLASPETHGAITLKNISYYLNCANENVMPDEDSLEQA